MPLCYRSLLPRLHEIAGMATPINFLKHNGHKK